MRTDEERPVSRPGVLNSGTDLHCCVRKQNVFLTAWLTAPILVVALLCYWIIVSLQSGPKMNAEPVGAGAGRTGGANAIGELLSERRAHAKVVLAVEDRTGLATAELPLLLAVSAADWQAEAMTPTGEGRWTWEGTAGDLKAGFEISWVDGEGNRHRDPEGRRHLLISSGTQVETLAELVR